MISGIEEAFGPTSLVGWQFAADGKWDEAARFFYKGAQADVIPWLRNQTTDNIAFEAIFTYDDGRKFFIGVRITRLGAAQKISVMKELLTQSREGQRLGEIVQIIRSILNVPELMNAAPDYLELGVFDLWNRVGSKVVWKGNDLTPSTQIEGPQPDEGFTPLHTPQPQQYMLEGAWKAKGADDFQAWIGLPVSDYVEADKHHIISEEKYIHTAKILVA